jgi:hypothetical protein
MVARSGNPSGWATIYSPPRTQREGASDPGRHVPAHVPRRRSPRARHRPPSKDGEALAARLGWPIVREYSDNDLSASKYSHKPRQGYVQMLQDLQEGTINAVVVYDQDRLVRQPKELEELLEVCDRARAWHIAAVSGEIDVRNSDDLFRARILADVHAKESDNISRRVRRKQQELAERGRPHGGPRRYGYRSTSAPSSPTRPPSSRSWPAGPWPGSPSPRSAES